MPKTPKSYIKFTQDFLNENKPRVIQFLEDRTEIDGVVRDFLITNAEAIFNFLQADLKDREKLG